MTNSWPDRVVAAAADCTAILEKAADGDWSVNAQDSDWSCRYVLDHMALGLIGYAGLVIAQPSDRFTGMLAAFNEQAPIPVCLEGVRISATVLASAVREAGPDLRAFHPWGASDGPGFAAMGVLETVVHTYDIAVALGLGWVPADDLCAPVVERLFPDAPTGHAPAGTLLWCTGRIALPGLPRRPDWGGWDGTVR
ncbi:maleylpyruvate isomerase N-terminal domain-containing protein [Streptomyces sp. NPDC055287]